MSDCLYGSSVGNWILASAWPKLHVLDINGTKPQMEDILILISPQTHTYLPTPTLFPPPFSVSEITF